MQLAEWFDDLAARFLLNLPFSETSSLPRFCFQIEEAQWYYEDFVRPMAAAAGQQLPNLPLRHFSLLMFQHCPLWNEYDAADLATAYDLFLEYKVRVPVRGAILLDQSMEKLVLVKGYKRGANWSFPRGKINIDEDDLDCAIREVYEETGFDIRAAGLVPQPASSAKYIDITMREQHMRMFVFRGVPLDTHFEPQTRKEISKVQFYTLRDLPGYRKRHKDAEHDPSHDVYQANKFYMVAPFLGPLKKWIGQQRRASGYISTDANQYDTAAMPGEETDDGLAYHIPHISNEEKSEALKKLLSIGAFAQSDLPQTALDSSAYNYAAAQHATQISNQVESRPQSLPLPVHQVPQNQQKTTLLQILQGSQQQAPALSPTGPSWPMQTQHNAHPAHYVQQDQGNTTLYHSASQQPVELPATSPLQMLPHTQISQQMSSYPQKPPEPWSNTTAPGLNALAPPKRMLLQLLSAPKVPAVPAQSNAPDAGGRTSSEHASKLLGLLRSPTNAAVPVAPSLPAELSSDNTVLRQHPPMKTTDSARPEVQQRKPTLNEFTRTLPVKSKKQTAPNPSIVDSTEPPAMAKLVPSRDLPIKEAVEQNSRTANQRVEPHKMTSGNVKVRSSGPKTHNGNTGVLQSSASAEVSSSTPKHIKSSVRSKQKSAKAEAAPAPAFTILSRPESRKDNESSQKPPAAILQREIAPRTQQSPAPQQEQSGSSAVADNGQKQDKLLALFGSRPTNTTAPEKQTTPSSKSETTDKQDNLLKLFAKSTTNAPLTQLQSSRIADPTDSAIRTNTETMAKPTQPEPQAPKVDAAPKTSLLDLFKTKSSVQQNTTAPASPFMLATPEILRRPQQPIAQTSLKAAPQNLADDGKRNSVSTPTESRGFLLDYLNGVVQKEGNRG